MNEKQELILIPKYEKYMEYMLQVIMKLPRVEKFNIGNEFKLVVLNAVAWSKERKNLLKYNKTLANTVNPL